MLLLLTTLMVAFKFGFIGEPIENGGFKAIKSGKGTKFMNANDLFDDRTSDEDFVPNYEDASEEESLYASDIEKEAKDNNYVYRGGFQFNHPNDDELEKNYYSEELLSGTDSKDEDVNVLVYEKSNGPTISKDFKWSIGMKFSSSKEFKEAMSKHSVLNGRQLKFEKNDEVRGEGIVCCEMWVQHCCKPRGSPKYLSD